MAKCLGIDIGHTVVRTVIPQDPLLFLEEPAVVAVSLFDHQVTACGNEAVRLSLRVPGSVRLVYPFSGETTPEPELAVAYFQYIVKALRMKGADLYLSLSGQQDPETEQVFALAAQKAGFRDVSIVGAVYAAANGCGVSAVSESAVVNIGASVTDMACFVHAKQNATRSNAYAGNALDRALCSHVLKQYRYTVTPIEARRVKEAIGTLTPSGGKTESVAVMRPAMGLPKKLTLTEEEVSGCFEPIFDLLTDEILSMVRTLPVEPDKVILTGGGAKLAGLANALAPLLLLPVEVAKEPDKAVIRGLGYLLSQKKR